jgi:hypothetical protein
MGAGANDRLAGAKGVFIWKSISIKVGGVLQDQAIESFEETIQLLSCCSAAPSGKKNLPVGIGGIPVGAGIGDASHIDVATFSSTSLI